jgi:hypothetical protein
MALMMEMQLVSETLNLLNPLDTAVLLEKPFLRGS